MLCLTCGCSDSPVKPDGLDPLVDGGPGDALGDVGALDASLGDIPLYDAQIFDPSKPWRPVASGTFQMGSPANEPCRGSDETQHSVTLTRPFEIMATEVTQEAFEKLMGYNPSHFTTCGATCPVEQVSWHEAAAYCNALSIQEGLIACYVSQGSGNSCSSTEHCDQDEVCLQGACSSYDVAPAFSAAKIYACSGFRLPTEAEWEFAYRAETLTAFYSGHISTCMGKDLLANAIGWYTINAAGTTHPVGQLAPNAWGLFDMAGNVYEWCHDWLESDLGFDDATDPWGSVESRTHRVLRGGSWDSSPMFLRAAHRFGAPPSLRISSPPTPIPWINQIGFRCARTL
jgi:formylglycine-generating enzyme required for sulfatase activity